MITRRDVAKGIGAAAFLGGSTLLTGRGAQGGPISDQTRLLAAQQAFLDLRFGMFIHLNMATFQDREWGDPAQPATLFNPSDLDTDQWARSARSANMTFGCLTTKHHDGFCLWPTRTGSLNVMQSSYSHDVVRRYVDSFRKAGLKVCLYYSILDLRADIRPHHVTPDRIALIKAQLTELLTQYGPITALVLDGWAASWTRISYAELPFREVYDTVKRLQPDCLVTDHNADKYPAPALYYTDIKQYEQRAGQKIPPNSSVPSQSGTTLQRDWFWKTSFPSAELIPARSVVEDWLVPFNANHCNFLLNVAPNRAGRFDDNAVARLQEIGQLWRNPGPAPKVASSLVITTPSLARDMPAWASSSADTSGPDLALDEVANTHWAADPAAVTAWLEVRFPRSTWFDTIAVVAPVGAIDSPQGSKPTVEYRVEVERDGRWVSIVPDHHLDRVGLHRIARTQAKRVRLVLAGREIGIGEFGIYDEKG
jgi:alpha-L-fucosidase